MGGSGEILDDDVMIQKGNNSCIHICNSFVRFTLFCLFMKLPDLSPGSKHQKVKISKVHISNRMQRRQKRIHSLELLAVSPAGN